MVKAATMPIELDVEVKQKKEGGVGRNVTSVSKRSQKPNLQKIKAMVDGQKKRIKVCTTCIKSDRVTKAY